MALVAIDGAASFAIDDVTGKLHIINLAGDSIAEIDFNVMATGGVTFKGGYDAATDTPSLDDGTPIAISKGDMYVVTVAGNFFTEAVQIGDGLIANIDSALVLADWTRFDGNAQTVFPDDTFRIQDDADATKEIAFQASGITTGTTRTITVPDQNIDLTPGTGSFATEAEGNLAATALQDLIDDTTPQLGGNLDANGKTIDGRVVATDGTKLDGIESNATIDQTGAEIKTLYEAEANAYTDAKDTKLSGIETSADVTDEGNVIPALDGATITSATVATDDKILGQDLDDADNLKTFTAQSIADLKDFQKDFAVNDAAQWKTSEEDVIANPRKFKNIFRVRKNITLVSPDESSGKVEGEIWFIADATFETTRPKITDNSYKMGVRDVQVKWYGIDYLMDAANNDPFFEADAFTTQVYELSNCDLSRDANLPFIQTQNDAYANVTLNRVTGTDTATTLGKIHLNQNSSGTQKAIIDLNIKNGCNLSGLLASADGTVGELNVYVSGSVIKNNGNGVWNATNGAVIKVFYTPDSKVDETLVAGSSAVTFTKVFNIPITQLEAADNAALKDDSGNEQIIFKKTASAVNELTVTNAATAGTPSLSATGDDNDIDIDIQAKGTGVPKADGVEIATISDTQTLTNKTIAFGSNTLSGLPVEIGIAVSDEDTDLTTGTAKVTFRMPFAMTLNAGEAGARGNVNTAPTGSGITVDINEGGSTILSTKLTIAATSKTSVGGTAPVISDTALASDAEMTIDIDGIGSTIAGKGLKIWLIGVRA